VLRHGDRHTNRQAADQRCQGAFARHQIMGHRAAQ
jgi:hypothetical protein